MIHQRLVLELTLETTRIANAVPRFDADERCLFAKGTPEGDDRGTEADGDLWLAIGTQQLCTMQLTLVDLDGVVAPGVVRELHDTVFCLYEGHFVHLVRAIEITVQGVHWLLVVKTDMAILVLTSLHARYVKGWMTTYLEVYLQLVRIMDMSDDTYLIIVKYVADAEGEVVRIDFLGLFARFEGEGHLSLTLGDERKVRISRKAMTR